MSMTILIMNNNNNNMYKCKELLSKVNTTSIKVMIDNKIYTMYYNKGTLSNNNIKIYNTYK